MAETRRNLIVGVFVLVGIVALGTLIVLFGRGPSQFVHGDTYPLSIHFEQVAGVRAGNLVTVRGITVGRVVAVDVTDPDQLDAGVDVRVAIEQRYRFPVGSRARATEPVLGQGRPPVEIVTGPSGGEFLPPGATLDGTIRSAVDSIFPPGVVTTFQTAARQIGDAAEALTPVLGEIETMLESRTPREVDRPGGLQGNLSSAIARLDSSLKHFNDVLGDDEVKSKLRETVANLHEMSQKGTHVMSDLEAAAGDSREIMADARNLVAKADRTLESIDGGVETLTQRTMTSLDKVDGVFDHLSTIGRQIAAGEGTIGRLIMDDKLYEALLISAERLAQAIDDARDLIAEWRQGKIRVAL